MSKEGRPLECTTANWAWDREAKSEHVKLSGSGEDAYFFIDPVYQSTGTAAVRGGRGFHEGEHYWEIKFLEPPSGTSVMVGVGTGRAGVQAPPHKYIDLLGHDCESWGLSYKGQIWHRGKSSDYCEAFFDQSTVIGLLLNMYAGTLTFFINGVNQGVAFTGLHLKKEPLYPMLSSTTAETEMSLGVRTCRYLSLQDKCASIVRNVLISMDSVDNLPLPNIMKNHIRAL